MNRGRALGTLTLARATEGSFTPEDVDFLSQAAGQIAIAIENALAYGEISELKDKLAQEKVYLEEEIRSEMHFEQIVGSSPALKHVLELVETVAPSDSTVLLLGETGTGKGVNRPRDSRPQPAYGSNLCKAQLRRYSYGTTRERIVRSRKGRVHGRNRPKGRTDGTGGPGHVVPRRSWRHSW